MTAKIKGCSLPITKHGVDAEGICVERLTSNSFRLHIAPDAMEAITHKPISNLNPLRVVEENDDSQLTPVVGVMIVHATRRWGRLTNLDVYPSSIEVTVVSLQDIRAALREIVDIVRRATGNEFSPVYRLADDNNEWDGLLTELFGPVGRL